MAIRKYLWAIVFLAVFSKLLAPANSLPLHGEADPPYHIKADTLSYDDITKTYQARGRVTIGRGDESLRAEALEFNTETKEAEAWGSVRFFSGRDWVTGSHIQADLEAGTGTVYSGTLFIDESHFYVRGDEIHKTGKDSYHAKEARVTTCDGDRPDWEMTCKDLRVTIEGYGTAKHVAFRTKSIPILYVPYLVFPAKTKRQTGLLMPQIGYSSRNGFECSLPFFWAISESSDATFYEHYMGHRGFKQGLEYRYALAPGSKGTAMYDFLYDRKVDEATGSEDSGIHGYEGFGGDDEDRTNRKRWWLRLKSDQQLPAGFDAKLDLDLVSDQDYLREFHRGYSGYKDSDHYFLEEFARGLEDRTETIRLNQLNLNKIWKQYALNADMRWYDDVITRKEHDPDPTLQRLPHIQFAGSKQKLGNTPLYLDFESSYDYFWRDYGPKGHRTDLHPRLYYPWTLLKSLDFEPSFGARQTLWQVEINENEDLGKEDHFRSRTLFDFKADLSTELSRVFSINSRSVNKIRHAIRPQVVYEYVPVPEDKDYPYFEGIDRMEEKHLVTYSVTNYLTAKSAEQPDLGSSEQEHTPKHNYDDFCRIKLTQSYDILEARRHKNHGKKRPFSDIGAEVEFRLSRYLYLDADLAWSPYDSEFKSYNGIVALCDDRGDTASVDYRYAKGSSKSILAKVDVKLFHPVSAYCEFERDLGQGQGVETVVGFRYEPQCWSLNVGYTHDQAMDSQEYYVEISLHGLGKVGG